MGVFAWIKQYLSFPWTEGESSTGDKIVPVIVWPVTLTNCLYSWTRLELQSIENACQTEETLGKGEKIREGGFMADLETGDLIKAEWWNECVKQSLGWVKRIDNRDTKELWWVTLPHRGHFWRDSGWDQRQLVTGLLVVRSACLSDGL